VIDSACMLVEYEELGGMQGSYIDNAELSRRQSGILTTVEMELTGAAGATGGWSGAAALNSVTALLKAGREYAILGITSDIAVAALSIQGPCTGNYRNGVPGDIRQIEKQHQGFKVASALSGVPMIPVLNASDAPSTQLAFLPSLRGYGATGMGEVSIIQTVVPIEYVPAGGVPPGPQWSSQRMEGRTMIPPSGSWFGLVN